MNIWLIDLGAEVAAVFFLKELAACLAEINSLPSESSPVDECGLGKTVNIKALFEFCWSYEIITSFILFKLVGLMMNYSAVVTLTLRVDYSMTTYRML